LDLFIDTNIYLSFYRFTSEDLNELGKLAITITKKDLKLYVPEQVKDEFWRNREHVIAEARKKLMAQKFNLEFPNMCKGYGQYSKLRQLMNEFEEIHTQLLDELNEDISAVTLIADKTIKTLFGLATLIPTSSDLIEKAKLRVETGKPPGKTKSLCDALSWEALLTAIPVSSDGLYFVSGDNHYSSPLDNNLFNRYLDREWGQRKMSELHFYKQLSSFFKDKFPDIKLLDLYELEKEILISRLAASPSFTETHKIVASLSTYSEFTVAQLNDILKSCVFNFQVLHILSDTDIRGFVDQFIFGNKEVLDPDYLRIFIQRMQDAITPIEFIDVDF